MASSPLIDLLAHEANAIRWLDNEALAEFLTDLERDGWEWTRHHGQSSPRVCCFCR
jgi:hypothetical protein